jgi:chemotaxis protein CheD
VSSENIKPVSIGEMIVSKTPEDILVAYGLGSCVAVCLHDPVARVSGMLHALLPTMPKGDKTNGLPAKFVDQGIPLLLNAATALGAQRSRLLVHVCGGAQMLTAPGFNNTLNIGERNVAAASASLQAAGFSIKAQATGGHSGRTVKLYVASGQITVKTLGQGEIVLS